MNIKKIITIILIMVSVLTGCGKSDSDKVKDNSQVTQENHGRVEEETVET